MPTFSVSGTLTDSVGLKTPFTGTIVTQDADTGWTTFTATAPTGEGSSFIGAGTRQIFVSQSTGNDTYPGTMAKPKKTIAAGKALLRDGKPDWLLLKKGDVWTNEIFGNLNVSGKSASEPIRYSSYGVGVRPIIQSQSTAYVINGSTGGDYMAITGLEFYSYQRDPSNLGFIGGSDSTNAILMLGSAFGNTEPHYLLIEDCKFSFYSIALVLQFQSTTINQIIIRRNVIVDQYAINPHRSQGAYIECLTPYVEGSKGLLIEENFFDHNGWNSSVSGAQALMYNHNIYVQNDSTTQGAPCVFRGNFSSNASSHGLYQRPAGVSDNNCVVRCGVGIEFGYDSSVNNPTGTIKNNVVLNANSPFVTILGWGINIEHCSNAIANNNIVAHQLPPRGNGFGFLIRGGSTGIKIQNNIVYNVDTGIGGDGPTDTIAPNDIDVAGTNNNSDGKAPHEPFPFPNRSVDTYAGTIGLSPTLAAFIAAARNQRKDNWRNDLMAAAVNNYIRAGYNQVSV